jgi:signal transduction histidine kinase
VRAGPGGDAHRGLANIRGRLTELGGTVTALSRRGGGLRLVATVPLPGEAASDGPG